MKEKPLTKVKMHISFYNVTSGLSALSISLYIALVFRVIVYLRVLYMIALSTRATLNVVGKCVVLMAVMRSFVHCQHDDVMKIKYTTELRSRYAKFVYFNHNHVTCECHMLRRHDREPGRTPMKKLKRLSQKSRKLRVFMWERILKVTPLSSKLHGYIGWRLRSQIKRRPGPPINNVDPTLTVKAPYSQRDITVFGANAGQQCKGVSEHYVPFVSGHRRG